MLTECVMVPRKLTMCWCLGCHSLSEVVVSGWGSAKGPGTVFEAVVGSWQFTLLFCKLGVEGQGCASQQALGSISERS